MRALVVYESMYGNTKEVAEAVAEGLGDHVTAQAIEVGAAPAVPDDVDLLVVGGPTHQFGMSRESSRESAQKDADGPLVSPGIGIREWIEALPRVSGTAGAATFATNIRKPWLPGSAGKGAAKRLRRLGYRMVVPDEIFRVEGGTGPLSEGERERARAWGSGLGAALARADTST